MQGKDPPETEFELTSLRPFKALLYPALAFLLAFSIASVALAAIGDIDTTFGNSGSTFLNLGFKDEGIQDLLILPNGKIIAVGQSDGEVVLLRFNQDGTLDTSFDDDGYAIQDLSDDTTVRALARQSDGKYLVAGQIGGDMFVARFNANGSLDTANFGAPDGFVTLDFNGGTDQANGVAVQSDGKILLAGYASDGIKQYIAAARFIADGSLDTATFNSPDGYNVYSPGLADEYGQALVLESDGSILISGYGDGDFKLVRIDEANGDLDTSFGTAGRVTTDIGDDDQIHGIDLQSDGKIVVVGQSDDNYVVARYTSDGSLDTDYFNPPDGYRSVDLGYGIQSFVDLAIDEEDRIVAVGYGITGLNSAQIVMRFTSDGDLDTDFSDDGIVELNLKNDVETANAVALGSIIVGGSSAAGPDGGNFFVMSLTTDASTATSPTTPTTTEESTSDEEEEVLELPETGFAPSVVTALAAQPPSAAYTTYANLQLAIPRLGVDLPIVGVPQQAGAWDVSWLAGQAGYLEGSAFPTLPGNTALTGHATDANGQPGPFAQLAELAYGDQVRIQAWGQVYTYEVRSNDLVWPGNTDVLRHEDYDWLTLITCQGFDESSGDYLFRRVVRAVLVSVD